MLRIALIGWILGLGQLWAQGSGSVGPPPSGGPADFPDRPFEITHTSVGTLGSIAGGVVTVSDEKIREPRKLQLKAKSVRVTADKKSTLAGKKKLTVDDLEAGMYVRVTYRAETREVLEIRVLKPKTV